jgi:phage repressor protein C with HTH and peptisase S24 domain
MSPGRDALFAVRTGEEARISGETLRGLLVEVLARGAAFRFRASGFSMSPFIRDGDVLTVVPFDGAPRRGDVAAYLRPEDGKLAVHRVVGRKRGVFILKGDNERFWDFVPILGLLGIVSRVERKGGEIRASRAGAFSVAVFSRWGFLPRLYQAARRIKAVVRPEKT